MNQDEVLRHFRETDALLEGHFLLSSGLHSSRYLQCAKVLSHPERAATLCRALADKVIAAVGEGGIDIVVAPAMGGVVVGYEMARQLGVPGIFTERVDGEFTFRRGFELEPGARVLMSEDIVTTGKSSLECIKAINAAGGTTVAASCLIDRSDGEVDLGLPLVSLTGLKVPSYEADALPPELAAIPAIKPGSRGLK
ncbi:MAG: orotate phosphoribosyltransferase [Alphaproteobacteria bacterium]|jgi:orotate phosphoribosyltransferase|nr:orotate phosphoribosyltransferase [Alphaproteobacteria bacterium]MBT4085553.1 orotate phosphoribosyltransferase [Alphaproteobacteria bacterium]MBT4544322.1 orotate phosphoribosyltransferase [Alphaproteobacteria bacterium]